MTPDVFQAYLARLDLLAASLPPTRETLGLLQRRHMEEVPFENLDVIEGTPIAIGAEAALDKVVRRRRGGFCFELNEAFRALLSHLGFVVTRIEGRVRIAEDDDFGAPFDHLALVVTLPEGQFLADVGFGDGPREPLPYPAGEVSDPVAGTFRLEAPGGGFVDLLCRKAGEDGFRPLYRLTGDAREIDAFAGMCAFHQTSPKSIFTRSPITTIATPTGRMTLTADRLIVTEDGRRHETPISPAERARLLREHFFIESP